MCLPSFCAISRNVGKIFHIHFKEKREVGDILRERAFLISIFSLISCSIFTTFQIYLNMKMTFFYSKWALLLLLISSFSMGFAQKSSKKPLTKTQNYAKYPVWIDMMQDKNVNYFEAIKAYETFWKHHEKPKEEEEIIGEKFTVKEKAENRKLTAWERFKMRREQKEEKEMEKYAYQCKRFEHWVFINKPYVQPDGRLLSTEERLELWKTQRKN